MKALTLRHPWPPAIFLLGKSIENRNWKPWPMVIGKRIAIHAGMREDPQALDFILKTLRPNTEETIKLLVLLKQYDIRGAIIGTVLVDGYDDVWAGKKWAIKKYKYFWKLSEPIALSKPIYHPGAYGLWNIPPDIERRITLAGNTIINRPSKLPYTNGL